MFYITNIGNLTLVQLFHELSYIHIKRYVVGYSWKGGSYVVDPVDIQGMTKWDCSHGRCFMTVMRSERLYDLPYLSSAKVHLNLIWAIAGS